MVGFAVAWIFVRQHTAHEKDIFVDFDTCGTFVSSRNQEAWCVCGPFAVAYFFVSLASIAPPPKHTSILLFIKRPTNRRLSSSLWTNSLGCAVLCCAACLCESFYFLSLFAPLPRPVHPDSTQLDSTFVHHCHHCHSIYRSVVPGTLPIAATPPLHHQPRNKFKFSEPRVCDLNVPPLHTNTKYTHPQSSTCTYHGKHYYRYCYFQ